MCALLDRHADVRTGCAEPLQASEVQSSTPPSREYVNWIARQVAMRISEQALQDAILSLVERRRGAAEEASLAAGGKESKADEGKRK